MKLALLWQTLIKENPMMAEIGRFRKRYLSFQGPSTAVNGGLGLLLVAYAIFSIICVYFRGEIYPVGLLHWFLFFALFSVPLLLHSTISGERERRSWDMLMVAPITHAQIIIGKFVGAFLGLLLAFGIFMVPVLIDALFYPKPVWAELLWGCLIVIAQIASVIALTILISARVNRPLTALAVTIAVVLLYFLFVPILISSIGGLLTQTMIQALSPFGLIEGLGRREFDNDPSSAIQETGIIFVVITNLVFEFVLTTVLLAWATKTLKYADNEVKFLPKQKKHA